MIIGEVALEMNHFGNARAGCGKGGGDRLNTSNGLPPKKVVAVVEWRP